MGLMEDIHAEGDAVHPQIFQVPDQLPGPIRITAPVAVAGDSYVPMVALVSVAITTPSLITIPNVVVPVLVTSFSSIITPQNQEKHELEYHILYIYFTKKIFHLRRKTVLLPCLPDPYEIRLLPYHLRKARRLQWE